MLLRKNRGIIDEPRSVIGGVDVETEKSGKDSFCCGAGGANVDGGRRRQASKRD